MEHQAPASLEARLQQFVREQLSRLAPQMDAGTFDEEDDFDDMDADEDVHLLTDYQVLVMADDHDSHAEPAAFEEADSRLADAMPSDSPDTEPAPDVPAPE